MNEPGAPSAGRPGPCQIDAAGGSLQRRPGRGLQAGLGPLAAQRLQHKAAVLRRLAGIASVVRLAPVKTPPHTPALYDDGGLVLNAWAPAGMAVSPLDAVALARDLAAVLAGVHAAGVIHKDIAPANIQVHPQTLRPTLIDPKLAASLNLQRAVSEAAGTLQYMAPEQTGRTGRSVDARADLYALGVVLYQLLTGRLPFDGEDVLALIHQHLAVVRPVPHSVCPPVPPLLLQLVMRLLEKEPERRYQSADGLAQNLARLHEALQTGAAPRFRLAAHVFAQRPVAPARPVGPETEAARLQQASQDAVAGRAHALLVTGPPGVGKSALIGELRAGVAQRGGVRCVAGR